MRTLHDLSVVVVVVDDDDDDDDDDDALERTHTIITLI